MLSLPRPRRHNIPGMPQHVTQRGNNDEVRRKAYRELFDGNVPCTQVEKIRYTNSKGLPLGSKSFLAEIESQLKLKLGSGKVGRPRKEI